MRNWLTLGLALVLAGCGTMPHPTARDGGFGARAIDAGALADLKRQVVPLRSTDPGADTADLRAFGQALGAVRVVGLGEATHGTSEFFRMKHRLVSYLVEQQGFSVFAIEDGLAVAEALNGYIQSGEGNPREILAGAMFVWNTQEMLELVEWMRSYNQRRGGRKPLSFAGFDVQNPTYEMAYVQQHLAALGPEAQQAGEKSYIFLQNLFLFLLIPTANKTTVLADIKAVVAVIDKHQRAIEARHSPAEFRRLRHYAMNVVRCAEHYMHVNPLKPVQDPAESARMFAKRDKGMAENVQWLAADAYAGQKIMLWAHNGHVGAYERYSGLDEAITMGHHLKKSLGRAYYPLGFAFHRGSVSGIANFGEPVATFPLAPAGPDSAESFFKAAGLPRFYLNMRAAGAGALGKWLARPQPFRNVGYMIPQGLKEDPFTRPTKLAESYDGLMFIEESRPSRPLAAKAPGTEAQSERRTLPLPQLAI